MKHTIQILRNLSLVIEELDEGRAQPSIRADTLVRRNVRHAIVRKFGLLVQELLG